MNFYRLMTLVFAMTLLTETNLKAQSNPQPQRDDITVERLMGVDAQSVRIVKNPDNDKFYYSVFNTGNIYELTIDGTDVESQLINTEDDHNIQEQMGGMMYHDGHLYLAGSIDSSGYIRGVIMKGEPGADAADWTNVMTTGPYLQSQTWYDHRINAVELDPTGEYLLINSGSRSDHGEETYGVREEPITSAILRIPVDSEDLFIPNTEEGVEPYVFADGTRNSFGFAHDNHGNIIATENSGDRDHPEEINWLREGRHYGFPWNMGGLPNPQQFPDYDPGSPDDGPSTDPFIQEDAGAWYNFQSFENDPDFPQKPDSIDITLSIRNYGPHADKYRDTADADIKDASDEGTYIDGFTSHLSPAGIVIDNKGELHPDLRGGALVSNFNDRGLLEIFAEGGDLMHLDLTYVDSIDNFVSTTTQLVGGFVQLPDLEQDGNELYIIEFSYGNDGSLWKVTLPEYKGYEALHTGTAPTIDGVADETIWDSAYWAPIDQVWVGESVNHMDYEGRYKVCWNGSRLYFLVDVYDDIDVPMPEDVDQLANYWDYDNVEIFVDEDHSGGDHQENFNAFAYHISPFGNAADICPDGGACLLNDHIEVQRTVDTVGSRVHSVWEVAIDIYDDTFDNTASDNSGALAQLDSGKVMGFAVSSGDNDDGEGEIRDSFYGSVFIEGDNKNLAWQTADVFDNIVLTGRSYGAWPVEDEPDPEPEPDNILNRKGGESRISLYPNPSSGQIQLSIQHSFEGKVQFKVLQVSGTEVYQTVFSKSAGTMNQQLDLSHLQPGIYLTSFKLNNEEYFRKLMIQ